MTRKTTTLGLSGLEPDNLLAFLALLGTLRALETAQPTWQPRVTWDGPPWRAGLDLVAAATQADVTAAVLDGMRQIVSIYAFGSRADINWTVEEFRKDAAALRDGGDPERLRLLGTLASDGFVKQGGAGKNEAVTATALCAMFGAGHQHFLKQLAQLQALAEQDTTGQDIADTLFASWQYVQREDALKFRWDPAEDRRYAYRFGNPSGEKIGVAPGANVLAALGLPLFVVAPRHDELRTLAFGRNRDTRERYVSWPIWDASLTVASIRALLGLPVLGAEAPARDQLAPYGVAEVMRATRLQNDKYFNFSRARPMWGSRASPAGTPGRGRTA